jgi:cytochrome bd ubiquinol oxidase subunit I
LICTIAAASTTKLLPCGSGLRACFIRADYLLFPGVLASHPTDPYALSYLGSLILTHSWNGEIKGLNEVPPNDRPYVPIVFFAFRAMVGIGSILLILAILGAYPRWHRHLFIRKWFLTALVLTSPLGFVATIAGWLVTEAGRQPYVIYGVVRTADAASPLAAVSVGITFI